MTLRLTPTTFRTPDRTRWFPVKLKWGGAFGQWGFHGVELGAETAPGAPASARYMPGLQGVFAQVLSLGKLRVIFGGTKRVTKPHIWS
jgi:hypothetical protein